MHIAALRDLRCGTCLSTNTARSGSPPRRRLKSGTHATASRMARCGVAARTAGSSSRSRASRQGGHSTLGAARERTRSGLLGAAGRSLPSTSPRWRSVGRERQQRWPAPRSSGSAGTRCRRRCRPPCSTWCQFSTPRSPRRPAMVVTRRPAGAGRKRYAGMLHVAAMPRREKYFWWYSSASQNVAAGTISVTIGRL